MGELAEGVWNVTRGVSLLGVLLSLVLAGGALGQGIEGGGERSSFQAGDQILYEANLSQCPVGETLPEWRVARGGYECARFRDRIWIRPLAEGSVLYLTLPEDLPEEFSLEFTIYGFEEGEAGLRFSLHPRDHMARFRNYADAWSGQVFLGGWIAPKSEGRFGAFDRAADIPYVGDFPDFRHKLAPGREYRIAAQVRRGQARFFVDGRFVGQKPFRPEKPIGGLSLLFAGRTERTPYKDAPVLVTDIRLATYSGREVPPQAERDLPRPPESPPPPRLDTRPVVMVVDFAVAIGWPSASEVITERIVARMREDGSVRVLSRSQTRSALEAANLDTRGMLDAVEVSRAARQVGADYVVMGEVEQLDQSHRGGCLPIVGCVYTITAEARLRGVVVDAETATVVARPDGQARGQQTSASVWVGPWWTHVSVHNFDAQLIGRVTLEAVAQFVSKARPAFRPKAR